MLGKDFVIEVNKSLQQVLLDVFPGYGSGRLGLNTQPNSSLDTHLPTYTHTVSFLFYGCIQCISHHVRVTHEIAGMY